MKKKIGVIGGGSWGTALAVLLANKEYSVQMWLRDKNKVEKIEDLRVNQRYLPGVKLPSNLQVTSDLKSAISGKDIILLSIPTHGVREVLNKGKIYMNPEQIIVNVAKGIENQSLLRISQIVEEILPNN